MLLLDYELSNTFDIYIKNYLVKSTHRDEIFRHRLAELFHIPRGRMIQIEIGRLKDRSYPIESPKLGTLTGRVEFGLTEKVLHAYLCAFSLAMHNQTVAYHVHIKFY